MKKGMVFNIKTMQYEEATKEEGKELLSLIDTMNADCAAQPRVQRIGGTCPECDSEVLPSQYCMMGHWCGEPANR